MSTEDLIQQLQDGSYECAVCSDPITFHDSPQLWWCERCFQILHRNCAKKWAVTKTTPFVPQQQQHQQQNRRNNNNNNTISSLLPQQFPQQQTRERQQQQQAAAAAAASSTDQTFSCPNCRASLKDSSDLTLDSLISKKGGCGCYCGRVSTNLTPDPGLLPGSCGEPCPRDVIMRKKVSKTNKKHDDNNNNDSSNFYFCNHPCPLLCHPGLHCPPCKSIRTMKCNCGRGKDKQVVCGDFRGKEFYSCGEVCGKPFPCQKHFCKEVCHQHNNDNHNNNSAKKMVCGFEVKLKCGCGREERSFPCPGPSSDSFVCGNVCGKKLSCGVHTCSVICCDKSDEEHKKNLLCQRDPKNPPPLLHCNCGKTKLSAIAMKKRRTKCTDPLPGCGNGVCGKQLPCGKESHTCTKPCHDEDEPCSTCLERVTLSCRCGKGLKTFDSYCFVSYVPQEKWEEVLAAASKISNNNSSNNDTANVKSSSTSSRNNGNDDDDDDFSQYFVAPKGKNAKKQHQNATNGNNKKNNTSTIFGANNNNNHQHQELPPTWPLLCTIKCNQLLSCNKHKCEIVCCNSTVSDDHFCPRVCKKTLPCRQHECNRPCHGNSVCGECPNVSYEPLFCTCGKSVIDPPVKCGVPPPSCNHPCSIAHPEGRTCGHDNIGPRRENVHACHSLATECPPCMVMVPASCYSHHEPLDWLVPCYKSKAVACARKCGKKCFKCVNWRDGAGGSCDKVCHDLEKSSCVCSKCKKEFDGLEVPPSVTGQQKNMKPNSLNINNRGGAAYAGKGGRR